MPLLGALCVWMTSALGATVHGRLTGLLAAVMVAASPSLARLKMPYNVSVFGIAAAIAALGGSKHIGAERARDTGVRAVTAKGLQDLGCKPTASQGNFLFVDVGQPARTFRDACAKQGVVVGRDFPPFEHSHVRISIGTMEEMTRATAVFRDVLRPVAPAAIGANGPRGGGR